MVRHMILSTVLVTTVFATSMVAAESIVEAKENLENTRQQVKERERENKKLRLLVAELEEKLKEKEEESERLAREAAKKGIQADELDESEAGR